MKLWNQKMAWIQDWVQNPTKFLVYKHKWLNRVLQAMRFLLFFLQKKWVISALLIGRKNGNNWQIPCGEGTLRLVVVLWYVWSFLPLGVCNCSCGFSVKGRCKEDAGRLFLVGPSDRTKTNVPSVYLETLLSLWRWQSPGKAQVGY